MDHVLEPSGTPQLIAKESDLILLLKPLSSCQSDKNESKPKLHNLLHMVQVSLIELRGF